MKQLYSKTLYIFILIINSLSFPVYSQSSSAPAMPTVIPPSPTVANLMNFEEVPVDNYTGQPDISIPLYTKQLNSELSLPLVLKYSSMGVRIEQRSGWTGTGWSLDAGGVISRTVRGFPDETTYSPANDDVTGVFHNDQFWNLQNLSYDQLQQFVWNINGDPDNKFDSQPDLFQFSMLGFSGRFIIVKEGAQFVAKQVDMNHKMKINFTMNSSRAITDFTIIDANGYKYEFGSLNATETTLTQSYTVSQPRDPNNPQTAPEWAHQMPAVNSAWHLISIKTSNGETLATFNYTNSEEYFKSPFSRTWYDQLQPTPYINELQSSYNVAQFKPMSTVSRSILTTQTKKLIKISFRDSTSVHFMLSPENSHIENQGVYLTKIQINKQVNGQDAFVRAFSLNTEIQNDRLWLMSVNGWDGLDYQFEYFEKDELPDAEEGLADHWGYNRSDFRNDLSYGYNYYDYDAIKRGLLTKIIYPTGGAKEFTWAANTFSYEGNQLIDNFDSNPYNSNNSLFTHQFTAEATGEYTVGQTLNITHQQYIFLSTNITPLINSDNVNKFEVRLSKTVNGVTTTERVPLEELPKLVSIAAGTYTVTVQVKINSQEISTNLQLSGYLNIQNQVRKPWSQYSYYLLGGGVRLARVKFYDPSISSFGYKTINYNYTMDAEVNYQNLGLEVVSSGATDSRIGSMYKEYILNEKKYLYDDGQHGRIAQYNIGYKVRTNEVTAQLTRGNYVGYKRVAVYEGTAFNGIYPNGYTEYIYTTAFDSPVGTTVYYYPFIEAPNIDFMRGLLTKKALFNKDGQILEETINTYSPTENDIIKSYIVSYNQCHWRQFYKSFTSYKNNTPEYPVTCLMDDCFGGQYEHCFGTTAPYTLHETVIRAGRADLTSSIVKKYFYNGSTQSVIENSSIYAYNPVNYQLAQQVNTYTEGTGNVEHETIYEYPVGGYTPSLFQDINDAGNTDQQEITNMVNLNIINKPIAIHTYKNAQLVNRIVNKYKTFAPDKLLLSQVETYKGGQTSTTPEDRIIYSGYNEIGNVTEVYNAADAAGKTCYVWAFNGTVPVAEVKNISGYATLDTQILQDINSGSISGLESNLAAALTAFRNQASVQSCFVTTLTQDPVDGVLSVTDPKGDKTTYHYDILGRLEFVKDELGNILSANEYHFK